MKNLNGIHKSALVFLLVLVLFLPIIAACGKGKTGDKDAGKTPAPVAENKEKTENSEKKADEIEKKDAKDDKKDAKSGEAGEFTPQTFKIEGCTFDLTACNLIDDSDGDTNFITTWKFHNETDEERSTTFLFYYEFFQGDQELDDPGVIFLSEDSTNTLLDFEFARVAPGEVGTFFLNYKLKDKSTPVKMELSGFIDSKKYTVEVPIEGMEKITVDDLDIPK